MRISCILPGCTKSQRNGFIHLKLYPRKDKKWRTDLLEFCCRHRDRRSVIQIARREGAVLCHRHFKEDDFFFQNGRQRVIPGRLPTLNLPKRRSSRIEQKCAVSSNRTGRECSAFGCNKRRKQYKKEFQPRTDSEGNEDEESKEKRKQPRTFHLFPTDPILLRKWVVNIRRKDWFPDSKSIICSDHFKEEDIVRSDLCARLKPGALPTRFKLFEPHFKENHLQGTDGPSSEYNRCGRRECKWANA